MITLRQLITWSSSFNRNTIAQKGKQIKLKGHNTHTEQQPSRKLKIKNPKKTSFFREKTTYTHNATIKLTPTTSKIIQKRNANSSTIHSIYPIHLKEKAKPEKQQKAHTPSKPIEKSFPETHWYYWRIARTRKRNRSPICLLPIDLSPTNKFVPFFLYPNLKLQQFSAFTATIYGILCVPQLRPKYNSQAPQFIPTNLNAPLIPLNYTSAPRIFGAGSYFSLCDWLSVDQSWKWGGEKVTLQFHLHVSRVRLSAYGWWFVGIAHWSVTSTRFCAWLHVAWILTCDACPVGCFSLVVVLF